MVSRDLAGADPARAWWIRYLELLPSLGKCARDSRSTTPSSETGQGRCANRSQFGRNDRRHLGGKSSRQARMTIRAEAPTQEVKQRLAQFANRSCKETTGSGVSDRQQATRTDGLAAGMRGPQNRAAGLRGPSRCRIGDSWKAIEAVVKLHSLASSGIGRCLDVANART